MAGRKGPSDSATVHPVGKVLTGIDGNQWRVTETAAGVRRWARVPAGGFCAPCAAVLGGGAPAARAPAPSRSRAPVKREGPPESASLFEVGAKKKGRDGDMWVVGTNARGARRWQPVAAKTGARRAEAAAAAPRRKSPSESASGFKTGTRKKGNDGRSWIVATNRRTGENRWMRFPGRSYGGTDPVEVAQSLPPGTRRRGRNGGAMYTVVSNSNGTHRWAVAAAEARRRAERGAHMRRRRVLKYGRDGVYHGHCG